MSYPESTAHNELEWTEEDEFWDECDETEDGGGFVGFAIRFIVYTAAITALVIWLSLGIAGAML